MSGLRLMSSRPGFLPPLFLAQLLSQVLRSTRRRWHCVSYSALVRSSMLVSNVPSQAFLSLMEHWEQWVFCRGGMGDWEFGMGGTARVGTRQGC